MTPEDIADMQNDAAKVDGPQRVPAIHLGDETWARDIGYGSLILHKTGEAIGLILEPKTIQELMSLAGEGQYGALLIQEQGRTLRLEPSEVRALVSYTASMNSEAM